MAPPRVVRSPSEEREYKRRCAEARRFRIRAFTEEERARVRAKNAEAQRRRRQRPEVREQEAAERLRRREERRWEAERHRAVEQDAWARSQQCSVVQAEANVHHAAVWQQEVEETLQQCSALLVKTESHEECRFDSARGPKAEWHSEGLENAEAVGGQRQYGHAAQETATRHECCEGAMREQEINEDNQFCKQVVALWQQETEEHQSWDHDMALWEQETVEHREWRKNVSTLEQKLGERQETKQHQQCSAVCAQKTEGHCEQQLDIAGRVQQAQQRRQRQQNRALHAQEAQTHCKKRRCPSVWERDTDAKQRRRMVETLQQLYEVICATSARGTTQLQSIKGCTGTGS